jgi:Ion channel
VGRDLPPGRRSYLVRAGALFLDGYLHTLGYGDIVLNADWRLFASFQAATGTNMFGWTAALIVALVHSVCFGGKLAGEA